MSLQCALFYQYLIIILISSCFSITLVFGVFVSCFLNFFLIFTFLLVCIYISVMWTDLPEIYRDILVSAVLKCYSVNTAVHPTAMINLYIT